GALPVGGGVAVLAGGRKSRGAMVRIPRAVVVVAVTGDTVARRAGEGAPVARGAVDRAVPAGEREARERVIERRRLPGGGRVTGLAGGRETRGDVVRIPRALELVEVARGAGGRGLGAAGVAV